MENTVNVKQGNSTGAVDNQELTQIRGSEN